MYKIYKLMEPTLCKRRHGTPSVPIISYVKDGKEN
jgi:hypothetical protein